MVSLGLLVLRVIVGSIFAVHGYTKVFGGQGKSETVSPEAEKLLGKGFKRFMDYGGIENQAGFLQSLGIPYPKPMAGLVMASEFLGGLLLILGWHTRIAALALTVNQIVAAQKVHLENGLINSEPNATGYEFNATLAAATAALTLAGPGKIAVD